MPHRNSCPYEVQCVTAEFEIAQQCSTPHIRAIHATQFTR